MAQSMTPEMFQAATAVAGNSSGTGESAATGGTLPDLSRLAGMLGNNMQGASGADGGGGGGLSQRQINAAMKLMGILGYLISWYQYIQRVSRQRYFRLGVFSLAILALAYYSQ